MVTPDLQQGRHLSGEKMAFALNCAGWLDSHMEKKWTLTPTLHYIWKLIQSGP